MMDTPNSQRDNLIQDAEYLTAELARGDAVPVDTLVKARPFIETLVAAVQAARALQAKDDDYRKLQLAMIDVMAAIAPVTVSSLRDTEASGAHRKFWFSGKRPAADGSEVPIAEVERFSDALMVASVLFLLAAMGCTLTVLLLGKDPHVAGNWITALIAFQAVVFGGLGACVYLLRALHKHIYERTFDRRYKPEYINRVVLGMVSGGVVTLLVKETNQLPDLAGIAPATLAFLVGYNTDLLFSLIERVSNALFPKVPDIPAPVAAPPLQPQKSPAPAPAAPKTDEGPKPLAPLPPPPVAAHPLPNGKKG